MSFKERQCNDLYLVNTFLGKKIIKAEKIITYNDKDLILHGSDPDSSTPFKFKYDEEPFKKISDDTFLNLPIFITECEYKKGGWTRSIKTKKNINDLLETWNIEEGESEMEQVLRHLRTQIRLNQ